MRVLLVLALLAACDPHDGDDDDTGEVVVDPLDPDVPPVTQGDWARPGARTTWQWQLQGTLNTGYPSELYDVDLFDTPSATIAALQADGRLVFCYLSAGSVEDWRDDASSFPASAVGDPLGGFPDERWLDIRHPDVHAAMLDRLDVAVDKGCDGVEPDNVDAWQATTGFPLTEREQLAYNRFLYNEAHTRGLSVAMKNDLDQVPDLVAYADVAVNEQCHELAECALLQPFLDAGKPIFNAEYDAGFVADPPALCRDALIAGTRSLILSPDLDDSVRVSCDEDFATTTGLADVVTYTTYYGRDADRIAELASLDLAIVQPLLTADQRAALQARAKLAVYLSIGEIGLSNTYIIGGEEVLGQVVYDDHPEWFLSQNPFFDSWFADTNQVGWQDFVLDQADLLLAQGYDGLFMDTVDTVDVYPDTIPGMVTLIGRLRDAHPNAILVQNRGMNVIPQSGPDVDALMFEVFSSTYNFDDAMYVPTNTEAPGYAEIVQKAVDYRLSGGVVLAQDFADDSGTYDDLICYARDRALMHHFVPAIADKFFQDGLFDYPTACPWPEQPVLGVAFDAQVGHVPLGRTVVVDVLLDRFDADTILALGTAPAGVTANLIDASVTAASPGQIELSATGATGTYVLPVEATSGGEQRTFGLRVVVHDETVWVTNAGLSNVVAFDEPGHVLEPVFPSRRTGGVVAQPYAIAVDGQGYQWVAEYVGDPAAPQPAGRVLRYAPFDLAAPDVVVEVGLTYPTGVAIDAGGTVWVANAAIDWGSGEHGTPHIATVAPGATTAVEAFQYAHASLGYPLQLAVHDGDLWVTTTYGLALGFALPAPPSATPFAVIAGVGGADDVFGELRGLVFDGDGDLWVSGMLGADGRIVEIPAGTWATNGSTTTVTTASAGTQLSDGLYKPWGIAFDSAGSLWVVNSTDAADTPDSAGSLVRFDTLTSGASPAQVIPLESRFTLGIAVARP